MSGEIGGGNGLMPITWPARMGLPVVDADGMGRAFPKVSQVTMSLAGISPCPAVIVDERGNLVVLQTVSDDWAERLERAAAVEFGGIGQAADFLLTAEARTATVRGSVSLAIRIGEAISAAESDPVQVVIERFGAFRLVTGKVLDVARRVAGGFTRGSVVVDGVGADAGRLIRLELQNENLLALEQGQVLASVPDLITVLDSQTADAISAERIRYGHRVTVIAFPCDPVWRSAPGLEVAGPQVFGYEIDYQPIEELAASSALGCWTLSLDNNSRDSNVRIGGLLRAIHSIPSLRCGGNADALQEKTQ